MTWSNQTDVSGYPWTHWQKITFDQSFVSKHQNISFENCRLGRKTTSKVVGILQKFEGWEIESFSVQCRTEILRHGCYRYYLVSFHGKGMTVQCHPTVQCRPT